MLPAHQISALISRGSNIAHDILNENIGSNSLNSSSTSHNNSVLVDTSSLINSSVTGSDFNNSLEPNLASSNGQAFLNGSGQVGQLNKSSTPTSVEQGNTKV